MSGPVKNVIVVGASGNIGAPILNALLATGLFKVSILSRSSSSSIFPPGVNIYRTEHNFSGLLEAFRGQDAVVSAVPTFTTAQQHTLIDAAVAAGVQRFIPSDFGFDTAPENVADLIPQAKGKQETITYLRSKEGSGMSWTAITCGGFFDWAFSRPGLLGWNIPARKATIFDGGNVKLEFTNLTQIGRAVAAALEPTHLESTKNSYVYVNSFTVTHNEILEVLERLTGAKFTVSKEDAEELAKVGLEKLRKSFESTDSGLKKYTPGDLELITAGISGYGGFNCYSKRHELWNERLDLPQENMEATLKKILLEANET